MLLERTQKFTSLGRLRHDLRVVRKAVEKLHNFEMTAGTCEKTISILFPLSHSQGVRCNLNIQRKFSRRKNASALALNFKSLPIREILFHVD